MISDKITNDISNISMEGKKSNKTDNCQELKNIAYKTMLLNGTDINPKHDKYNNDLKISSYLECESSANKKETWSKLDKTQKIKHLYNYTEILKEKDELSEEETEVVKLYCDLLLIINNIKIIIKIKNFIAINYILEIK